MRYFKFVIYLATVLLFVLAYDAIRDTNKPRAADVLRYEMKIFDDGEVILFDTVTGDVKQLKAGDRESLLPKGPQLPVPQAPKAF